jgi:hypothetical protein
MQSRMTIVTMNSVSNRDSNKTIHLFEVSTLRALPTLTNFDIQWLLKQPCVVVV